VLRAACAEAWPPVPTDAQPHAGARADERLLGTTERDDGSTQVIYAGHPLYCYTRGPGQVLCHDVDEFGGLWLVVEPSGEAVSQRLRALGGPLPCVRADGDADRATSPGSRRRARNW